MENDGLRMLMELDAKVASSDVGSLSNRLSRARNPHAVTAPRSDRTTCALAAAARSSRSAVGNEGASATIIC
jgi:hypothetical protein